MKKRLLCILFHDGSYFSGVLNYLNPPSFIVDSDLIVSNQTLLSNKLYAEFVPQHNGNYTIAGNFYGTTVSIEVEIE